MRRLPTYALRAFVYLVLLASLGASTFALVAPERSRELVQYAIDTVDHPVSDDDTSVMFQVEQGESAQGIGKRLEQRGLIRSAIFFRLLVSYYGASAGLEAGEYELRPNMTTTEIISILYKGLTKIITFTVPEGWRITQISDALSNKGIFGREEFLKAAKQGTYNYDFLPNNANGNSLEGYLFPDAYRVSPSSHPSDLINHMLENFDQHVTPEMRRQASENGLTLHETITLASIVEREAMVATERPVIAGVFLNRLKLGMPLQADPTIQYALANDPDNVAKYGFWKTEIAQPDLGIVSPYNTYRNSGLPPGPISNPGLASIQAVLQPATTDYLYFVAKDDGGHAFAETMDEHERNVFRYRQ